MIIYDDKQKIAESAAKRTIEILEKLIKNNGTAVWAIAGGTTPEAAYRIIADKYLNALDWSKITIIIGDERIAPLNSPDSNWHQAEKLLLRYIPQAVSLRPLSDQSAELAANQYNDIVSKLNRIDLLWLGMGEDGHTLSLFPNHEGLNQTENLVIPIRNSPKPPSDRITLSLTALRSVTNCIILVTGANKAKALAQVNHANTNLPVAIAAKTIQENGGSVEWLVDKAAATTLLN